MRRALGGKDRLKYGGNTIEIDPTSSGEIVGIRLTLASNMAQNQEKMSRIKQFFGFF
jgi:uncharacterized protein YuzE